MLLKGVILALLAGIIISLISGFIFMVKEGESKRTFQSLGARVVMAVSLLLVVGYGLATGQLGSNAPWDPAMQGAAATATKQQPDAKPQSQNVDKDKQ